MFVSFIIFALSVTTYFWIDLPWYYGVPIVVACLSVSPLYGVYCGLLLQYESDRNIKLRSRESKSSPRE